MITTRDGLVAAIAGAQDIPVQKANITTVANQWSSLLGAAGTPGNGSLSLSLTAAGAVPDDTLAGTPPIVDFTASNYGYLGGFDCDNSVISSVRLVDRLFHAGSFVASTLQTNTLTSPASYAARLPAGNANGLGLELWLEVAVAISATATTVTVTYTNTAGTTGRTATLDANISGLAVGSMRPFRLQAGDTGIQSIQSVIVGGTVGTSGTFNVLVLRTLANHNILGSSLAEPRQDAFKTGMPRLFSTSCLFLMVLSQSSGSGTIFADIDVIQG